MNATVHGEVPDRTQLISLSAVLLYWLPLSDHPFPIISFHNFNYCPYYITSEIIFNGMRICGKYFPLICATFILSTLKSLIFIFSQQIPVYDFFFYLKKFNKKETAFSLQAASLPMSIAVSHILFVQPVRLPASPPYFPVVPVRFSHSGRKA